jgi:hypothetical protein
MPSYRIIGADLKEYGPVSAEQIRQWITEGRVDSQTKLQAEGGGEWKRLADVPELAAALPHTTPSACPNCGEPFEDGFNECWKCGTGKDGSPPKEAKPFEVDARWAESVEPCPKCGSPNVRRGEFELGGRRGSVIFRPEGKCFFTWSLFDGVVLSSDSNFACLDCGLAWGHLQPGELKEYISKHCRESGKEDADALLSEAAGLESKGDTAGALAKYEAVRQRFRGTEAARDAEASIRSLKGKVG